MVFAAFTARRLTTLLTAATGAGLLMVSAPAGASVVPLLPGVDSAAPCRTAGGDTADRAATADCEAAGAKLRTAAYELVGYVRQKACGTGDSPRKLAEGQVVKLWEAAKPVLAKRLDGVQPALPAEAATQLDQAVREGAQPGDYCTDDAWRKFATTAGGKLAGSQELTKWWQQACTPAAERLTSAEASAEIRKTVDDWAAGLSGQADHPNPGTGADQTTPPTSQPVEQPTNQPGQPSQPTPAPGQDAGQQGQNATQTQDIVQNPNGPTEAPAPAAVKPSLVHTVSQVVLKPRY